MTEAMIEDMTLQDNETEKYVKIFLDLLAKNEADLQKRIEANEKKGGAPLSGDSFYICVRNALFRTFIGEIMLGNLLCVIAETSSIGFTTSLIYLIAYIKDDDAEISTGIIWLCAFSILMLMSTLFKNHYMMAGANTAVRMRKTLVASMYKKISKLSMKSLTQTNSGKLITIVSGDI